MWENSKIVFVHKGNSWYLSYALNQARSVNGNSDVVLIGDGDGHEGVQVVPFESLDQGNCDRFRSDYQHRSPNGYEFELFCWLRWFYLLEYMRREQVNSVLHLDSDVLLCSSLEEISRKYSDAMADCAFLIPRQDHDSFNWAASAHMSFWTIDLLEDFCAFCLDGLGRGEYQGPYKEKWNWHLSNQKPGGVSDMTTLYLFWRERQAQITNLAMDHYGNVFDMLITSGFNYYEDEYLTDSGRKRIRFIDRRPYVFRNDGSGSPVRVHALHFQGVAKRHIPYYYSGSRFRGKTYRDMAVCFQSARGKLRALLSQKESG
jgi:hypothetical protein